MKTIFPKVLPALLILAGVTLIQFHSVLFWESQVEHVGFLWSLTLMAAAIWLWSARNSWLNLLALVVTVLELSGPLYNVSEPVVQAVVKANQVQQQNTQQEADLRAEISQLSTSLATYLANSTERFGWAERIDNTQAALDSARADLKAMTGNTATAAVIPWRSFIVIGMQALALIVFQLVIVLAVRRVTEPAIRKVTDHKESAPAEADSSTGGSVIRRLFNLKKSPASAISLPAAA